MANKARDRINRLLSGKSNHPFDFLNNPLFFDPQPDQDSEYTHKHNARVKLAYVAANAVSRGLNFVFIPGSMSNGYRGYEIVKKNDNKILQNTEARYGEPFLTTQRLTHNIASEVVEDELILHNRQQQHSFAAMAERRHPDFAVLPPVAFEGPIRVIRENSALSQGAAFQDWTFENWWVPRVIDCSGMMLGGDHAYSRYANMEEMTADLIQCGFLDKFRDHVGAGDTFDITDSEGRQVTLADRAWETAKHIVDVVDDDFRTDLAVAALVVRFQIDDWLRENSKIINTDKLHPVLKKRSKEELAQMDRLKEIMLPYIAEKCAHWMPFEKDKNLKQYFKKSIVPARDKFSAESHAINKKELFSYMPRGGFVHPHKLKTPSKESTIEQDFNFTVRPPKRRGTDGRYFNSPAKIFDDNLFAKRTTWEKATLCFVMGAKEAHYLPENAPRTTFYVCEPKGGMAAQEYAQKHSVDWLRESQGAESLTGANSFYERVMSKNKKRDSVTQETLADETALKDRGVRNIVSSLDFGESDEAVSENRIAIAAKGGDRLSPDARLALQMEWMDRNAEVVVLRKGWQYHPQEVQLMMRAVLHATGQVDRPYEGGKYRMEIFEHDADAKNPAERLKKQDLHSLAQTLASVVEPWLDSPSQVPARAHYVTMARLLEVGDKLMDPGARNYDLPRDSETAAVQKKDNETIGWQHVDRDFISFKYSAPQKAADFHSGQSGEGGLRSRLLGKLQTAGVLEMEEHDLEGLHDEYRDSWNKAHGMVARQKIRNAPGHARYLDHTDPT